MSVLTSHPALRWLAPAGAALAIVAGGVAIGAVTSAADPTLPTRSAAQLLVDLQTARLEGLSGTVVLRSNLGLPPLPGLARQGGADLSSLISGTHTLRVWYSGPDKARVAILGTLGETDIIRNGRDVWTWSSQENKASHATLPPGVTGPPTTFAVPGMTPDQVARAALAAIEPSTEVRVDGSAQVAGRDAYELVLVPRDRASLVASVRLAIDATEHLPLRVAVYARGVDQAAIEVAFTGISFTRPDPDQFVFNPPPGAAVVEEKSETSPDEATEKDAEAKKDAEARKDAGPARTAVVGSGWTSVFVLRVPTAVDAEVGKNPQAEDRFRAMIKALPRVSGPWGGGHVLSSRLFSVLITDDGRMLVGAVQPQRLVEAAADPAAKLPPSKPAG
jgi:outer membrane lipoprotein-sorting protein